MPVKIEIHPGDLRQAIEMAEQHLQAQKDSNHRGGGPSQRCLVQSFDCLTRLEMALARVTD